jgi:hypothetical protein
MRGILACGVSLVFLAGCAATGPTARPTDFPFHTTDPPFITLHWRVEQAATAVTATGIAELSDPERLEAAVVQLQGLDRDGRIVSSGLARVHPQGFADETSGPFTVLLVPRGGEERFTLHVARLSWREGREGR